MMSLITELGIPELVVEAGRGAGKSTGISDRMRVVTTAMPRSNNLLIGETYQQILTRTLPSTILGLENLGIFKDLHYFIGRRPPSKWKWPAPYQPPNKFDRFIWFWTGAGYTLISQDKSGDGRGLNSDSQIKDEAALLDREKLEANTDPTQRGSNKKAFEKSKVFLSDLSVSTTPLTATGKWFIDREEAAMREPDQIKFLKATCEVNKQNLPDDYLEKARKKNIPWIFEAEYLNIRPKQIKDGFYPLLDEDMHTYNRFNYTYYQEIGQAIDCRGDEDLVATKPLIIGVDWGATINCLVICQHLGNEFRALKSMYVLGDNKEVQSDLFKQLHDYYRHHPTRTIYLWYDNMGNNDTGITKYTRAQMARKQLSALGWNVQLMTRGGRNPEHGRKHILWNAILREDNGRLPVFRMNRSNCRELWVSMFNAAAKMGSRDEIQKDKSSERSTAILRQHATDLSDAIDAAVYGMFHHLINNYGGYLPSTRSHGR